jgi:hypothetical protein
MRHTDPLWIEKWSKINITSRRRDFSTAVRRAAVKEFCLIGSNKSLAHRSGWLPSSKKESFVAQDLNVHRIFVLTRKSSAHST